MSFLALPGTGPMIDYGGQEMELLAGQDGKPAGFAVSRMVIPARFAGPIPHAHDSFDEGIYVLSGRLSVIAGEDESVAGVGAMLVAPRGDRHGFANPFDEPAEVLTFWSPGELGIAFMAERAAVITGAGEPDPAAVARFYARHRSRLLP